MIFLIRSRKISEQIFKLGHEQFISRPSISLFKIRFKIRRCTDTANDRVDEQQTMQDINLLDPTE
jgi:hypothetical protein